MNAADVPGVWVPDWPAPAGVRALCTERDGGVSAPPWDRFNLGDHVGDDPAAVALNRARLASFTRPARPVFLRQVHGTAVCRLDGATPDGTEADAAVAVGPGVACTIMVADCLPVLFALASGAGVAAAHAGWRGLAAGVLERTVRELREVAGEPRGEVVAWLGPAIGPAAFEVGDEVRAAFTADDAGAAAHFRAAGRAGQWWADLPGLARRRLRLAGLTRVAGNDGSAAWCTVSQPSRFFSHRRDAARFGTTGRLAAAVWLG